jgi:hypothetical protein
VGTFNEKNNQFVFNSYSHLKISEKHCITGNKGWVLNDDNSYINSNFNYNSGDTFKERYKENTHDKPTNSDKPNNSDETEP